MQTLERNSEDTANMQLGPNSIESTTIISRCRHVFPGY